MNRRGSHSLEAKTSNNCSEHALTEIFYLNHLFTSLLPIPLNKYQRYNINSLQNKPVQSQKIPANRFSNPRRIEPYKNDYLLLNQAISHLLLTVSIKPLPALIDVLNSK